MVATVIGSKTGVGRSGELSRVNSAVSQSEGRPSSPVIGYSSSSSNERLLFSLIRLWRCRRLALVHVDTDHACGFAPSSVAIIASSHQRDVMLVDVLDSKRSEMIQDTQVITITTTGTVPGTCT